MLNASYVDGIGRSYVDTERGIFYRLPKGKRSTNKRQPPVAMPKRLLAHVRRWKARGLCNQFVVEWEALPIKSIKTGFASVCRATGIDGATPHTLRHSRVTHQMQAGVTTWEVAGFAGMSEKMVRDVYGHHSPEHLRGAAEAR